MKNKIRIALALVALNLGVAAVASASEPIGTFTDDTCAGPNNTVIQCCSSCSAFCRCTVV